MEIVELRIRCERLPLLRWYVAFDDGDDKAGDLTLRVGSELDRSTNRRIAEYRVGMSDHSLLSSPVAHLES